MTTEQAQQLQEIYNKIKGVAPILIGTISSYSGTINVKSLYPDDYMNFTINNFLYKPRTTTAAYSGDQGVYQTVSTNASYSYNNSTGVLSVSFGRALGGGSVYVLSGYISAADVYLIKY